MRLPDSLRERLRIPLGVLLPEGRVGRESVMAHLPEDPYIITVGDRTTQRMLELGLAPSLQITDGLERRQSRDRPGPAGAAMLTVANPAAEITAGSIRAVREALAMDPPVRIDVDGEEDLLVIPACIHAPDGAVVMYGQPGEGLVIVRVTPEIRNKTQALLDSME